MSLWREGESQRGEYTWYTDGKISLRKYRITDETAKHHETRKGDHWFYEKTTFDPNELKNAQSYVLQMLQSRLPVQEQEKVMQTLSTWVREWGEVTFFKKEQ